MFWVSYSWATKTLLLAVCLLLPAHSDALHNSIKLHASRGSEWNIFICSFFSSCLAVQQTFNSSCKNCWDLAFSLRLSHSAGFYARHAYATATRRAFANIRDIYFFFTTFSNLSFLFRLLLCVILFSCTAPHKRGDSLSRLSNNCDESRTTPQTICVE